MITLLLATTNFFIILSLSGAVSSSEETLNGKS